MILERTAMLNLSDYDVLRYGIIGPFFCVCVCGVWGGGGGGDSIGLS